MSNAVKEALPTISRSLTDIVRTNVYFNPMGHNEDTPIASVAGRSQRYNSLQIDGAVNNDLFGLAAGAGVPGGNAATQPISLDAIQEIQLLVSPYDVRQSGFSGGGINAITKTGTNAVHGTAFCLRPRPELGRQGREQRRGVEVQRLPDGLQHRRSDRHATRAFFFGTFDSQRRDTPSGFSVGGTGVPFAPGREADVDRFLNILRTQLRLRHRCPTPRTSSRASRTTTRSSCGRDFNMGRSQLTFRHNYVNAYSDNGFPTATLVRLPRRLLPLQLGDQLDGRTDDVAVQHRRERTARGA